MVECSQSTRYILDTAASSKPNIPTFCEPGRSTSRAKQSRLGITGQQGQGRQGRQGLWSTSSGPRWWPTSTSTANNTHTRLARPQETEAGGQGGPGRAWPRPRPSSGSASPAAVPEDFANIAYRFIQDWAATQPQCPRPGFPIKRRRSLPRASPRDNNPARPSVLVSTCHVDNHRMQEQWDAHAARRPQSSRFYFNTRIHTAP